MGVAVRAWIVELVVGLRPWQRAALVVSLCALALPLWFAVGNTDRYRQGQTAVTEGFVDCEWDGPCRGAWRLADGSLGRGRIDGLDFTAEEELVEDIPLFGGRDWAVADRGTLLRHAVAQYTVAPVGAALVVRIARRRSAYNQETTALMRRYRTTTP
ncbi:hypothetical protein GCM10010095_37870 [Streptomyces anthocyanicus]|uniref:Uncharacterized protein n=1 Tax=Streptomyces lividans 1326 TaxID=1200984 RepID=A0A7U9HA23_STRLI|nr:hypothetical protein SLI_1884 [Streptomyces lividans 1326]GGL49355.1 hypothetical protein GCM10010095_37870 [Streptomyces anthocyanicus]